MIIKLCLTFYVKTCFGLLNAKIGCVVFWPLGAWHLKVFYCLNGANNALNFEWRGVKKCRIWIGNGRFPIACRLWRQQTCPNQTDTKTETAQTGEKSEQLEELIIALDWVPNTNHTGLYVALENGYFKNQGFDVKIVQPSEDSASTLVANNRADLGVYFQPNMVKRLNKGEPIVAVATIVQHNNAGLLSLKSLGASTPKDLHGKLYSTWEDPVDDATVAEIVGKPLHKIPGESTDATTALKMNQFDYILAYYSWDGIHAGLKGEPTNFFYLKDHNPAFDYYSPVLIANSNKVGENAERYKKP